MPSIGQDEFVTLIERERSGDRGADGFLAVPISLRVLSDQLTAVLAYRRLVSPDERTAPSFLLESVEGGERAGRYSILGSHPVGRVRAFGDQPPEVEVLERERVGGRAFARLAEGVDDADPLAVLRRIGGRVRVVKPERSDLPAAPLGGWFGYAGYDAVRYAEPGKLPFASAPTDDRGLPDLEFGFYDGTIVLDHVGKLVHVVSLALVGPDDDAGAAYEHTIAELERRVALIGEHRKPLPLGRVGGLSARGEPMASNIGRETHAAMVERALGYIRAGDIFQVVIGQRFERASEADPFDVYRALRAVNPSPYMVYMQTSGCVLVASSPEILCRVRRRDDGTAVVTNRPLAGTRKRGTTPADDLALEHELLADEKERAEHVMLVDLGRNDVGVVAKPGTVSIEQAMVIERYSHVMHISSTVTGELRGGLDAWDALRAALPVGTISGAPKIRAMQIIDELERVKRGPYGGGIGYAGLDGEMDIALALRTMVAPVSLWDGERWTYHVQAAGGIVADSNAADEYEETVNKAAALGRAIEVAEQAFGGSEREPGSGVRDPGSGTRHPSA